MSAPTIFDRAHGALLGLCVGDALGAQVEFKTAHEIRKAFPSGVRYMNGGGPFKLLPGQVTDDSEMALALARSLERQGGWEEGDVAASYLRWLDSNPVDRGATITNALRTTWGNRVRLPLPDKMRANAKSFAKRESNGALMRCAPLALMGASDPRGSATLSACADARLTHANPRCVAINAVYEGYLRALVRGRMPLEASSDALENVGGLRVGLWEEFERAITFAANLLAKAHRTPFPRRVKRDEIGWVGHAFTIAIHFGQHATSFEEGLVSVVGLGGDADTNGAIAGALLGARFGVDDVPERWRRAVEECPSGRPEEFRPQGLETLARSLVGTKGD